MGDGLKILCKDKRHRSSSSLAGTGLEGTRSERKLDIRALIPEVDDHFAIAEARCEDLQDKIDIVKLLKRKKKLNKRSMTRVHEAPAVPDNIPFISVRTQPKKKVLQTGARTRRLDTASPRGYVDPATVEQHRMLGQVWDYGHIYSHQNEYEQEQTQYPRRRPQSNRADGDGRCGISLDNVRGPTEVACGHDDGSACTDLDNYDQTSGELFPLDPRMFLIKKKKKPKLQDGSGSARRRLALSGSFGLNEVSDNAMAPQEKLEEPVVELYRSGPSSPRHERAQSALKNYQRTRKRTELAPSEERCAKEPLDTAPAPQPDCASKMSASLKDKRGTAELGARRKARNYELPTLSSQLKQVEIRPQDVEFYRALIPFVSTKSTTPSHNIGVNIQQVLNGLKIQQPVHGIPMTIAHHMGLGHLPTVVTAKTAVKPSASKSMLNSIRVGRRVVTLPSRRSVSYGRLLALYKEGDGMVPRFLRAVSRPDSTAASSHYQSVPSFYTDRLAQVDDGDVDDTLKLKKRRSSRARRELRARLSEYGDVYREYEQIDAMVATASGANRGELMRQRDELRRKLAAVEEYYRKISDSRRALGLAGPWKAGNQRAGSANDALEHQ